MFYTIEKIDDHPCYDMQRILEVFFSQVSQGNTWSLTNQHEAVSRIHGGSTFPALLQGLYNDLLVRNNIVRQTLNHQFLNNNNIKDLCNNTLDLDDYISWDVSFGKKIKDFFIDNYPDKLDLGIFKRTGCNTKPTKRFYQDFIHRNGNICPFCSILPHKHPFGKKRGDFDHYLDKVDYPFAALNLDNLIPMCSECNQDNKHTANILINTDGTRREFIYPYDLEEAFRLEIENITQENGTWVFKINIITDLDPELVSSFDSVFNIIDRMTRELDKRYDAWLAEEVKRYILGNLNITIDGFKAFLLNTAEYVIDLEDRTLEAKLLEHALYVYLANTDNEEVNDIFLGSYLFDYLG